MADYTGMQTQFEYKGRKVETTRNQFGWITIVDGADVQYQQISQRDAELYGRAYVKQLLQNEIFAQEAKIVQPSALAELEYVVKQYRH
jgi:hypothetical protein